MLVTTTAEPSPRVLLLAEELSKELGAKLVARGNRSLIKLAKAAADPSILVVGNQELRYMDKAGAFFFFHPSMAMIRVKRLLAGEADAMVAAAGVMPGDQVIDCTMGLASDAIVFAHAVGASGRVEALESELIPYILAREGLQTYTSGVQALELAMRRIKPIREEHLAYLSRMPDKSADIVYFDPMFRRSASSSAIEPLRVMANSTALQTEAVEQAVRVARRTVIMKEHNRSGEFERLGFRQYIRQMPRLHME